MKLSISSAGKYKKCARAFRYHYVDKLRDKTTTAFLPFGSAIDNALNSILNAKKNGETLTSEQYKKIFDDNWNKVTINRITHGLPTCTLVGYAKADFEDYLLLDEDKTQIGKWVKEHLPGYSRYIENNDFQSLKNLLDTRKSEPLTSMFTEKEHQLLNLLNWCSLKRKGHLMLEAYVANILPQLDEIKVVQKEITLSSEGEHSVVGYIDFIARIGDKVVIMDNKTASTRTAWTKEKLIHSEQHALYCFATDIKYAGVAVMVKDVKFTVNKKCQSCGFTCEGGRFKTCSNEVNGKRCGGEWSVTSTPEIETFLMVEEIPQRFKEMVIENLEDVATAVSANVYPRNLDSCTQWFGGKCSYYNFCHKGKDDDLEKVD